MKEQVPGVQELQVILQAPVTLRVDNSARREVHIATVTALGEQLQGLGWTAEAAVQDLYKQAIQLLEEGLDGLKSQLLLLEQPGLHPEE